MYSAPTVYHEIQKEHRKHSVVKKSGSHYKQEFYAQTIYTEVPNAYRSLQSPTKTYLKSQSQ